MEARTERKRERATCIKPRSSGTGGGNSAGSRNSNGLCGFHVCTHKYIHTYTDELGVCVTRRNVSFSICVSGAAMVVFALYTTPRGKEGAKRGEDEGYRGSPNCDVGDAASVGITVRVIVARIQAGDSIKLDCGEANNQAVARPDRRVNPLSLSLWLPSLPRDWQTRPKSLFALANSELHLYVARRSKKARAVLARNTDVCYTAIPLQLRPQRNTKFYSLR